MDLRERLAEFISVELLHSSESVDFDENLLADGMVDSIGMLRLVGYIEATYAYQVPPVDFTIENFRNLNTIDRYLQGKFGETHDKS